MQEKESWELKDNAEKIEAAAKKKDEGNVWFKMGKYGRASKRYEKVTVSSLLLNVPYAMWMPCIKQLLTIGMLCPILGFEFHRVRKLLQ